MDSGTLGMTVYAGTIATPISGWRTLLNIGYQTSLNGNRPNVPLFKWENRFGQDRNRDLRFSVEKNVATEISLQASYYW
jgi:hypothetical protein